MPLPAVIQLIVEDDAVYGQYHETCYCQCQSHMQHSSEWASEWRDEGPIRPAEKGADDDEDDVENHQRQENGVGQEALLGEPSPHALGAAVDVGHDQQEAHHQAGNPDADRKSTRLNSSHLGIS